ncbi:MAG: 50S ribosomal protein L20 [Candidatus Paceibacterota bacterium]|jgi:large subunit ribosomal protein L20|nr:50S ribosomal protein L20 [Candidatus Paceibacterota bacterium]MDD5621121.1 50S ribosomal protein L20 [Candidatus Paceibacterota bacterium]
MTRVKRGVGANKKRKNLLSQTKGYKWGRKNKFATAKEAYMKAKTYAYRDRRAKKRVRRSLWQIQINAACRLNGTTYSKFINALTKSKVAIDRKILAKVINEKPEAFQEILKTVGIK